MPRHSISFLLIALAGTLAAQEPTKSPSLILIDATGKETSLAKFKFSQGTRNLAIANSKTPTEYLEIREDGSTQFDKGITTWVPLASVKEITFDTDKKSVAVTVLVGPDRQQILRGTTKYVGFNRLVVEYEENIPNLGLAFLKFKGGEPKATGKAVRFSNPVPLAPLPEGRKAVIIAKEKEKAKHAVVGLQALYQLGTNYRLVTELMFQIDVRSPLAKIAKMEALPPEKKQTTHGFAITLTDGTVNKLLLAETTKFNDSPNAAKLLGLLGQTSTGYKLFPAHTIAELTFEDSKESPVK